MNRADRRKMISEINNIIDVSDPEKAIDLFCYPELVFVKDKTIKNTSGNINIKKINDKYLKLIYKHLVRIKKIYNW